MKSLLAILLLLPLTAFGDVIYDPECLKQPDQYLTAPGGGYRYLDTSRCIVKPGPTYHVIVSYLQPLQPTEHTPFVSFCETESQAKLRADQIRNSYAKTENPGWLKWIFNFFGAEGTQPEVKIEIQKCS